MTNKVHTVDGEIIEQYVKALLAYDKKSKTEQNFAKKLFDDGAKVNLQINFSIVPNVKNKTFYFDVPKSPIFNETSDVCCFVEDKKNVDKYEYRQEVKEQIKEICPFVQEVIPIKVLKSDFVTYEQKKLLAQSYDFFVGDRSIFNILPSILGSQFIKQRKLPIKVDNLNADKNNLKEILTSKLSRAKWWVDGRGTCTNVIVGSTKFSAEELVKNIDAVLTGVAKEGPRGWKLIKSVHIKLENSIALKIYEKGADVKTPLAQSEVEKIHSERQQLTKSDLVQLYQTLTKRKRTRKVTTDKQIPMKEKPIKQPLAKKAKITKA